MDPGDIQPTLGKNARTARVALGLTQAEVAERIGVSVEFYTRLEGGRAVPTLLTLLRVARALEASLDWLLGRAPPRSPNPPVPVAAALEP